MIAEPLEWEGITSHSAGTGFFTLMVPICLDFTYSSFHFLTGMRIARGLPAPVMLFYLMLLLHKPAKCSWQFKVRRSHHRIKQCHRLWLQVLIEQAVFTPLSRHFIKRIVRRRRRHITRATFFVFFHMHHHAACLFLSSWCESERTLWNASLTHVVNISERETSESAESSEKKKKKKKREAEPESTRSFLDSLPAVTGWVCVRTLEVTVSYCMRSLTSWRAIKEVFEMRREKSEEQR